MKKKFEKVSGERYYTKLFLYNFQVLGHCVGHLGTLSQKTVKIKSLLPEMEWNSRGHSYLH